MFSEEYQAAASAAQAKVSFLRRNPAGQAVTMGGFWYNLILVTIGNMIGGILFVAVPYSVASADK